MHTNTTGPVLSASGGTGPAAARAKRAKSFYGGDAMRISPDTLTILKNFAGINERILIEPGNVLWIATKTGVLGKATVSDCFPVEIGIYELTKFLNVLGLFRTPECNFQENFVRIRDADGGAEVRYCYAAPSCVGPARPRKLAAPPSNVIEFELSQENWMAVQKATTVLGREEVRIVSDGRAVSISTYDHKNPDDHEFSTPIPGAANGVQCNSIFQVANLKLLKGSYHGTVTPNYTMFTNTSGDDLTYWVACDPESTFD